MATEEERAAEARAGEETGAETEAEVMVEAKVVEVMAVEMAVEEMVAMVVEEGMAEDEGRRPHRKLETCHQSSSVSVQNTVGGRG